MIKDETIRNDLYRLRWLLRYINSNFLISQFLNKITSKHPFYDISSIIWLFAAIGVYLIGFEHFFMVSINLASAILLKLMIQSKQPVEYDKRFKPLTNVSDSNYGLPSLECHMGIVILYHISYHYNYYLLYVVNSIIVFVIGLSRIYSRSRFPSQVVCSWATGIIGLILVEMVYIKMNVKGLCTHHQILYISLCMVVFLINFTMSIESNDSQLVGIKRNEYISVIRNIMETPVTNSYAFSNARQMEGMERMAGAEKQPQGRQDMKHDSFYYLQKTMEKREKIRKQQLQQAMKDSK